MCQDTKSVTLLLFLDGISNNSHYSPHATVYYFLLPPSILSNSNLGQLVQLGFYFTLLNHSVTKFILLYLIYIHFTR